MGPLVYYCRWRGARLRLRGRDEDTVWGELVTTGDGAEQSEPFRFDLTTWELWLGADGARRLQLDELGVVIAGGDRFQAPEDDAPADDTTTSAAASPE